MAISVKITGRLMAVSFSKKPKELKSKLTTNIFINSSITVIKH